MTTHGVLSVERRRTTFLPFPASATWRLAMDVGVWDDTTLSLQLGVSYGSEVVAMVRMPLYLIPYQPLSSGAGASINAAKRIAGRLIAAGDLEKDQASAAEAFQLFRNDSRVTDTQITGHVRPALDLVRAYWWVRQHILPQGEVSADLVLSLAECETTLYWRS